MDRSSRTSFAIVRLHTELALRAKGVLMMRENGFEVPPDDETRSKFTEMRYLRTSIGKTGLLAIHPTAAHESQGPLAAQHARQRLNRAISARRALYATDERFLCANRRANASSPGGGNVSTRESRACFTQPSASILRSIAVPSAPAR